MLTIFLGTERYVQYKDVYALNSEDLPERLSLNPWWREIFPDVSILLWLHVLPKLMWAHFISFMKYPRPSSSLVSLTPIS